MHKNKTKKKETISSKYSIKRINSKEWLQINSLTQNKRKIREILYDLYTQKRILWEFINDRNEWEVMFFNDDSITMEKINVNETVICVTIYHSNTYKQT